MNKSGFIFLIASIVCMGTSASARSYGVLGGNLLAPTINDKANVSNPVIGEIILDTSDSTFYGRSSSTQWTALGGASAVNPIGTIIAFAGASCPTGYLPADGKSYLKTGSYTGLHVVIDVSHGDGSTGSSGEGGCPHASNCFNVPDYRGRFLRGVANSSANDPDRTSRTAMATGGNTGDNVGSIQGHAFQTHTHSVNDPGHSHANVITGNSGVHVPQGGGTLAAGSTNTSTTGVTVGSPDTGTTSTETRPLNAYVNYCIKY